MNSPIPENASTVSSAAGRYLTVELAGETYGIAVMAVREIIRLQKITPLPRTPDFVKGVINLRGRVVPVIDLRLRFDMPAAISDRTCIVVVHVRLGHVPAAPLGLIVDAVEEVVDLADDEVSPTPDFGTSVETGCLLGMARVKDRLNTLLDINRVVAPETWEAMLPRR